MLKKYVWQGRRNTVIISLMPLGTKKDPERRDDEVSELVSLALAKKMKLSVTDQVIFLCRV